MQIAEFAELTRLMWEIWPARAGDSRPDLVPNERGELSRRAELYLSARWAVLRDIEASDATAAVLAIAEVSTWEPSLAEIRQAALGRAEGWVEGWRRLIDAIGAYQQAPVGEVEFVEVADGVVERRLPEGFVPHAWRETAGEDVVAVVEQMGGISHAAANYTDATFRAHFRDLYDGRAKAPDVDSGAESGAVLNGAFGGAIGRRLSVLRGLADRMRSLPSGR